MLATRLIPPNKKAPQALGGVVSTYGLYTVHTFLGDDNFVVGSTITCDILVVAGGGGSSDAGGGGGAGGYQYFTAQSIAPGTYAIDVGAGGTLGIADTDTNGGLGGLSDFGTTLADSIGGGGGASEGVDGSAGGSGGGGSYNSDGGAGTATGTPLRQG